MGVGGRGLQRLWGACWVGVQTEYKALRPMHFCGYCRHSKLKYLPRLRQPIPSNSSNRAASISEALQTKPGTCVILFADVDTSPR